MLRARAESGLTQAEVAAVVGRDRTALSRSAIEPDTKSGELALLLRRPVGGRAVRRVDLVVEAVPERLDLKQEVFREAIAENAAAIILVHNHPSGDPTPSPDDRITTEQLVQAGRVLDIPVQDHIIIGRGRYLSFAEAGLL